MPASSKPSPPPSIISFETSKELNVWLAKYHATSTGIWIRLYKKGSDIKSINYAEALDEALCYGWIDGQKKSYDAESFLQKFTPRRQKSIWSKINRENIARLEKLGKLKAAGLARVKDAKADGRWNQAYDSPSNMVVPEDFLKELSKHKKALAFFKTLNKANTYAISWRLQTAKKPETRIKRMTIVLEMLKREEKFH